MRPVVNLGKVLIAWLVLLAAEHLAIGFGYRALFVGTWEMGAARTLVSPIGLAVALPLAGIAVALGEAAVASRGDRRIIHGFVGLAFGLGVALGLGLTHGRHFARVAARAPFVLGLALVAAVVAYVAIPRMVTLAEERPRRLAAAGAAIAALCWCADAFVLPRLYPAFHVALFATTLAASALAALAIPTDARATQVAATVSLVGAVASLAWTPWAARRLHALDNLRLVLVEHAPLLGRMVAFAARVSPPPPLDDPDDVARIAAPGEVPRALDWAGRDIVLVSIDALRADHVGAYGYARPTTPNIDKLAESGVVMENAYCPTPHTSYSITSMMTGKYMRPLLLAGMGDDSDTWASLLRRYGYRTAAFYPPAVFFIDEARFTGIRDRGLDFEYRKIEFAPASQRATQVEKYLASAPTDRPLFLWVHLFEPHEPYVPQRHRLSGPASSMTDVDAYDSEIAEADAGVGAIVAATRARRPRAIVIVTADHGEEFGEHGGRYHGTTVYEEQVRVPLVVSAPDLAPRRVSTVVQTIDLLPTVLSALGIPRPARVRGRDVGAVWKSGGGGDPGSAFAETDEYTLLARGDDRLVCARKLGACALYRPSTDPTEQHDLGPTEVVAFRELRARTMAVERDHGRYERGDDWPEALRRGIAGDVDAAEELAALLDDARVEVRRKAAEVTFELHDPSAAAQTARALERDEDAIVRKWCALALVRMGKIDGSSHHAQTAQGEPKDRVADELLHDPDPAWRRRAALSWAERGDARGARDLVDWWSEAGLEFTRAREILAALAKIRDAEAAPVLARSLSDVRLRPYVADALGAIGNRAARAALVKAFAEEHYVTTRPHEAAALVTLGAHGEIEAPLRRFAGLAEPMPDAIRYARSAQLLVASSGGWSSDEPRAEVSVRLAATRAASRLFVLGATADPPEGTIDGDKLPAAEGGGELRWYAVAAQAAPDASTAEAHDRTSIHVVLRAPGGVLAAWLVPLSEELPPPPPEPWDGGTSGGDIDPDAGAP